MVCRPIRRSLRAAGIMPTIGGFAPPLFHFKRSEGPACNRAASAGSLRHLIQSSYSVSELGTNIVSWGRPQGRFAVEPECRGGQRNRPRTSAPADPALHRGSKTRGAGRGGTRLAGSDAKAQSFEVALAERHQARVRVAADEEQEEGNGGVVLVLNGVGHGQGEVESQRHLEPGHPTGAFLVC